jgi:CrcB protein
VASFHLLCGGGWPNIFPGNGVCLPLGENRLTVSALMTPTNKNAFAGAFMNLAYLWVAIGGALGSVSRYWINGVVSDKIGATFPWGTLVINVIGSFVIGILGAVASPEGRLDSQARQFTIQFLMIGVCGGYTTFSSFSLQTLNLVRDREWLYAGGNVLLSVVLCLLAVWLGWMLGATFNSMKN